MNYKIPHKQKQPPIFAKFWSYHFCVSLTFSRGVRSTRNPRKEGRRSRIAASLEGRQSRDTDTQEQPSIGDVRANNIPSLSLMLYFLLHYDSANHIY